MATVPCKLANEVIRQLNTIIEDLPNRQGVLVVSNDITYMTGSLNI